MVDDPFITVFVPGYNVESFVERCLQSIAIQHYPHFEVQLVDDASTDETGRFMDDYVNKFDTWEVTHNTVNQKMPCNLTPLRFGDPEDVIVIVDADDFLPTAEVLSVIAASYQDPNLWLMYGSYQRWPDSTWMPNPAKPFPPQVIRNRSFRDYSEIELVYNHPLTFRRRLLQTIEDWELQDDGGNWFTAAYDHTIMMPMLEMAADHFKFCPSVLYVYNEDNEQSEAKLDRSEGIRVHQIVNSRPVRDQL